MFEDKKLAYSQDEIEEIIAKTPFAVWVGAKLQSYEYGRVEVCIPLKPEIQQHHGFAHGAIVGMLADSACAWAAASVVGDVVTSEYKLSLLAPAVGKTLIGYGTVLHAKGRQIVCRADVYSLNSEKEIFIATALATIVHFKKTS